jgi:CheY-like chemotaxis protein
MVARVLVAGLDSRSLLIEAPLLRREGHQVDHCATAFEALARLRGGTYRLLVLGALLPPAELISLVERIRLAPSTRRISILVLLPVNCGPEVEGVLLKAGANAVIKRPLDAAALEGWVSKLLTVTRRVEIRVPVNGQVVGSPRLNPRGHFFGFARNISTHGVLLASPLRLEALQDVELDIRLPHGHRPFKALGRVVREAQNVQWPFLGFGVEFLYVPPPSAQAISDVICGLTESADTDEDDSQPSDIHATTKRGSWIYEVHRPRSVGQEWQVEIWRADRRLWRPGHAGPFFVVSADAPDGALKRAYDFISRINHSTN